MKLKEYLDKNGLGLRDFASTLGVSAGHLSYIANGKKNPSLPLAMEIEKKTKGEVKIDDLFSPTAPSRRKKIERKLKGKK